MARSARPAILLALALGACGGDGPSEPTPPASTPPATSPAPDATGCARTSIGVQPLTDLRESYKGESGGVYPGGSNTPPAGHASAGLSLARTITPLDAGGRPSGSGRYAFVSIGMSN